MKIRPKDPKINEECHLDVLQLEQKWLSLRRTSFPKNQARVKAFVLRQDDGSRIMPEAVYFDDEQGVVGDRWYRSKKRKKEEQIAVMNIHIAQMLANGQSLELFGDNLFIDLDISEQNLPVGTRLKIGDALCEVSPEPHRPCSKFRKRFGKASFKACFEDTEYRIRGIYIFVISGGDVALGDGVEVVRRRQ